MGIQGLWLHLLGLLVALAPARCESVVASEPIDAASADASSDAPRTPDENGPSDDGTADDQQSEKKKRSTTFRTFSYRHAGATELGMALARPDHSGSDPEPDETLPRPFSARDENARARPAPRMRPGADTVAPRTRAARVRAGHGALPPPVRPLR